MHIACGVNSPQHHVSANSHSGRVDIFLSLFLRGLDLGKRKISIVLHDYKYLTKMLDPVHQEALYFLNTFMAVGKSRKGRTVLPYRGRVSTC